MVLLSRPCNGLTGESVVELCARFKKEFPLDAENLLEDVILGICLISWDAFCVGAGFPRDTKYVEPNEVSE